MRALIRTAIVTAVVLALAGASLAAEQAAVEVPMSRVVLFSSGVGFFEHSGPIEGDAVGRLMFKTDQINDVLKSMVVNADGGSVAGVNYAARDPILRALKSFAIDLSGDPSLAELLAQVRGAQVEVTAPEPLAGKILNVERRDEHVLAGGADRIVTRTYLNLLTEAGVKSLPMDAIGSLKLTDEKLAAELSKALELLIDSHDTDRKPVEIRFTGQGTRNVRIGYLVETPVWKTAYRLEFTSPAADPNAPRAADANGARGFLQGWAIVENTSDVDWKGVQLSLVSGRPISFIQDLYTPLYQPRPVVVPELYASLRPQQYEEGIPSADAAGGVAAGKAGAIAAPAAAAPLEALARRGVSREQADMLKRQELFGAYAGGGATGEMALSKGVQSIAEAAQVGELFNFTIKDRVDIARRHSAMLPIINGPIAAEKVSIYNQAVLSRYPLNGVYLTNDTGLKMLGGPITVLDGGMYAGDARIDHVAPNDKRLISYAIDLNVTAEASATNARNMVAARIVRGVLTVSFKTVYTQSYTFNNKADVPRQIIVEQPVHNERKLLEPATYEEKTATVYRFRVPAAAGSIAKLAVKEEQVHQERLAILDGPVDTLSLYLRSTEVPQAVRDELARAIDLRGQLGQLQEQLKTAGDQLAAIKAGQERLRQNIAAADQGSDLRRRYLKKLADEEDQIERLEAQILELQKQIETTQNALAEHLKNLNV